MSEVNIIHVPQLVLNSNETFVTLKVQKDHCRLESYENSKHKIVTAILVIKLNIKLSCDARSVVSIRPQEFSS